MGAGLPSDFTFIAETAVTLLIIPARAFFSVRKRCTAPLLEQLKIVEGHRCVASACALPARAPVVLVVDIDGGTDWLVVQNSAFE